MSSGAERDRRSTARGSSPGPWLLAVVLVVGCRTAARAPADSARPPGVPETAPASEPACRACGGVWGPQGLAGRLGCNCRARDAGRACRDGADCEGQCVLGDPPQREPASGGTLGHFVGRCSERVTAFGCARLLPRGFARSAAAPADEPPPVICID